jgi:hypothetical protein
MNRQEQLDRRYYDTGLEDMGIGFKHEPLTPAAAPEQAPGPHKALAIETYRAILAELPYEKLIELAIKGLEGYGLK